jgi:hypothetical protein
MSVKLADATTYRQDMGRWHKYVLDGQQVKGVTTLISAGWPKNLSKWAAEKVADRAVTEADKISRMASVSERLKYLTDAPWDSVDRSAMRGTGVHQLAEQLSRGESIIIPQNVGPWVTAYQRFLSEWQPKVLYAEAVVFSRSFNPRYGGTFDMIADLADGRRYLLDIKTKGRGKGIWGGEHNLQLAMYRYADFILADDGTELPVPEVDECAIIHLFPGDDPDGPGEYQLLPMECGPEIYAYALNVAATGFAAEEAKNWVCAPLAAPMILGDTANEREIQA